jgi:phosphatidylserine decarboxylase
MGSTVIVLTKTSSLRFPDSLRPGVTVRMGQRLAPAA